MNTAEYERMYKLEDTYWWFVARRALVESEIFKYYQNRTDLTILDLGCGTGSMSAHLSKRGHVISADYSPHALKFCASRGEHGLVQSDAMQLPIASESVDMVVTMDVLEHLENDEKALCEIHRILRPGGHVFATVPAYPSLWGEHDVALMHFRRYLVPQLKHRVEASGLDVVRITHCMAMLYPLMAIQRKLSARKPYSNPPRAAMPNLPPAINTLLIFLLKFENALTKHINWWFGSTILCIATKH